MDDNMEFDSKCFYRQIEEMYDVTLRRNLKKSWEEYWAWLVSIYFTYWVSYSKDQDFQLAFKIFKEELPNIVIAPYFFCFSFFMRVLHFINDNINK